MSTSTTITSMFRVHGTHCWPNAPDEVGYLRVVHRHEFVIRMTVRVYHDDRDVEFHMLQAQAHRLLSDIFHIATGSPWGYDFGGHSCEDIAKMLGRALQGEKVDVQRVSVFEDDENGAEVTFVALANDTEAPR